MKIVNLEAFRALPANTVFSYYTPYCFDDLRIKGETWDVDFLSSGIVDAIDHTGNANEMFAIMDTSAKHGDSIVMNFHEMERDGGYEKDQLFAVWEQVDVRDLITRLQECLPPLPPP